MLPSATNTSLLPPLTNLPSFVSYIGLTAAIIAIAGFAYGLLAGNRVGRSIKDSFYNAEDNTFTQIYELTVKLSHSPFYRRVVLLTMNENYPIKVDIEFAQPGNHIVAVPSSVYEITERNVRESMCSLVLIHKRYLKSRRIENLTVYLSVSNHQFRQEIECLFNGRKLIVKNHNPHPVRRFHVVLPSDVKLSSIANDRDIFDTYEDKGISYIVLRQVPSSNDFNGTLIVNL